jgi:hypothetical protein
MTQYQQDLINFGGYTLKQIDRPYNPGDPWEISAHHIYQKLRDKMKQKNRIMTLVYGYYLGDLIQLSITPREKWKEFVQEYKVPNEYYFYLGATRIYKLFVNDDTQMYRTLTLTFNIIQHMKISEYQELLQYSQEISDLTNSINEL